MFEFFMGFFAVVFFGTIVCGFLFGLLALIDDIAFDNNIKRALTQWSRKFTNTPTKR